MPDDDDVLERARRMGDVGIEEVGVTFDLGPPASEEETLRMLEKLEDLEEESESEREEEENSE